jgi:hypothetical protein
LLRRQASQIEGVRKSAPETLEDELDCKGREEHTGYSTDNIRSGLSQEPDDDVTGAHHDVSDSQAQADQHNDGRFFGPPFRSASQ